MKTSEVENIRKHTNSVLLDMLELHDWSKQIQVKTIEGKIIWQIWNVYKDVNSKM